MGDRSLGFRHLPSIALLRSFECAARHESFTQAAEELHLTQSAISRQVRELEQAVGATLFRRVGRRVVLTHAGARFAEELAGDLENLRQTFVRAVIAGDGSMGLRVAVLPTLASRWLIPRLPDFSRLHPQVEISLYTRTVPFDLTKERFDAAIHFGFADWPDARMEKLFDEEMLAVASPGYLAKYGIDDATRLVGAPLLHLITRENAWSDWFAQLGVANKEVFRGKRFDQFSMIIAATVSSLGAALLPSYLIENELASGALVVLDERKLHTANSYFIVSAAGDNNPHVNAFARWLMSAAARMARQSK